MTAPQNIHLSKVNKNCLHRLFIEQATSMPPPGLPKPELNIEQLTLHEVRDILELGDLIFPIAAVLLQEWQDVVELGAGVGLDKPLQVGVDRLPGGDLLGRVVAVLPDDALRLLEEVVHGLRLPPVAQVTCSS